MKSKWLLTIFIVFLMLLSGVIGFIIGQQNAPHQYSESFYANILNNEKGLLHLGGIPENDINHRGEFTVSHQNIDAVYNIYGESIRVPDLKIGSQIRVVYDGMVLESYPGQLTHIIRIDQIE